MRCVTAFVFAVSLLSTVHAQNAATRVQTIQLQQGWNAVFLEVQPSNAAPDQIFTNLPVSIVASFNSRDRSVDFVTDPSKTQWKKDGWGVWYSSNRPDNFLTTLYALDGNRCYLVQADQACTLTVEGQQLLEPIRWKSDSFNIVGFTLDSISPPTFQQFFKGSKAHSSLQAYRLLNSRWVLVDPATTQMRDGEAYWVYCTGGSSFQGPVTVKLPFGKNGLFNEDGSPLDVVFRSGSSDPVNVTVQPPANLPLNYVIRQIGPGTMTTTSLPMPSPLAMPTLEAYDKCALRLDLQRDQLTTSQQSGLMKITTDVGTVTWISLTGTRKDLATTPQ